MIQTERQRVVRPVALYLTLVIITAARLVDVQIHARIFCVVVHDACLRRDAPAQKQIAHGDKFVALLQKLVNRGKRAVYARLVDIVYQNDRAVVAAGKDVAAHRVGVVILPVLRVDRPVDQRRRRLRADGFVGVAIGRTDVGGVVSTGGCDVVLCPADFVCDFCSG